MVSSTWKLQLVLIVHIAGVDGKPHLQSTSNMLTIDIIIVTHDLCCNLSPHGTSSLHTCLSLFKISFQALNKLTVPISDSFTLS